MTIATGDAAIDPTPAGALGRIVVRALAVLACATAIVALAALAYSGTHWIGSAPTLAWPAERFGVAAGQGRIRDGMWIIERVDANGAFIIALPTVQLDAGEYTAIEVEVSGLTERQPIAVFWRSRLGGGRTFTHPAEVPIRNGLRAQLRRDPNWNGPIVGLGVIVAGTPPPGAVVVAVRAVSASASATVLEVLRSWFGAEGWTNQSINVVLLGGQYQAFPFTLFAGLTMLLALAAWIGLSRRRGTRTRAAGAAAIVFAAWLVVDLRWLVNFARVEAQTIESLAGKSLRERKLAAGDGRLFAFIEQAHEHIARHPGRVFFGSDDAWLRVRGGYHLLPLNVLSIAHHRNLYEAARYRPSDWLCLYARTGVAYDAGAQALRLDDGAPIKAERVAASGVGELFRVLP